MRRPDGFDHRLDAPEAPADAHEDEQQGRRDIVRLDALRRRRPAAETTDASVPAAGEPRRWAVSAPAAAEPRRWALSAYADLDEDEQPAAAAPDAAGLDPVLPAAGGSNAQRVDRAWRQAEREQRRLDREELRETRREAKAAKRARIRRERAEVRRFTATRRRQLRVALMTVGGLALALALLVGLVWSPRKAVRAVPVEGAERIDPAVVQQALADQVGEPIATVSEEVVAERLATIPQIESFRLDVVPPSTVIVRLVERRPVAIVEGESGASMIDAAGVVLGPAGDAAGSLPRLEGIEIGSEQFEAVATMLVSVPSEVLEATEIVEAPTPSDIRLTLETGQVVQWGGAEESPLKADVVAALMATQDPSAAAVLDVRAPEHPVVRGGEPAGT